MKIKPPMFVFNTETYINNLMSLQNAFKKRMERFKVGYSFKTNPHPVVLKTACDSDCYAEVVSPYEFEKALEIGFRYDRIIYNGVCKDPKQALMCAVSGIVNIDSIEEILEMEKVAKNDLYIGARLTFDIGNDVVSRFGIPVTSRDFQKLIDIDRHSDHIHIVGLSCHLTHARSAYEWKLRAKIMADAARKFKHIQYIDLGGNMYSPMDERYANNFPEHVTFDEYAEAICPELDGLDVELILETGTPLIANAVDLYCEVIAVKKNKGKTFIVVNTSSYDIGIVCKNTKLSYDIERTQEHLNSLYADISGKEKCTVVGYTCIEDDIICEDFSAPISVGDRIVFHNVGAYSYSFASDFIMPKHEMIAKGESL